MKLAISFLFAAFAVSTFAQEPVSVDKPAPAAEKPVPNLSDNFSKVALKALFTIKNSAHSDRMPPVEWTTFQGSLTDTEVAAESADEKKATKWLKAYAYIHMSLDITVMNTKQNRRFRVKWDDVMAQIDEAYHLEDVCAAALESALRSRVISDFPEACKFTTRYK
jgi:hypothetical protein